MQKDHRHPHASPAPPWDFPEKGAWKWKRWLPKPIWKNLLSIHRATLPQKIESLNPSFLKIVNVSFGAWSLHFILSWLEAWVACLKPSSFGDYQDAGFWWQKFLPLLVICQVFWDDLSTFCCAIVDVKSVQKVSTSCFLPNVAYGVAGPSQAVHVSPAVTKREEPCSKWNGVSCGLLFQLVGSSTQTHLPISWERDSNNTTQAFPPALFFSRCYRILLFGVSYSQGLKSVYFLMVEVCLLYSHSGAVSARLSEPAMMDHALRVEKVYLCKEAWCCKKALE